MTTLAGVGTARYRRVSGVEAAPLQGDAILYHPESKRFFMLNATAAWVWDRLDQPARTEDLAAGLCDAFQGVEVGAARRDVQETLEQLVEMSLVEPVDGAPGEDEAKP